MQYVLHSMAFAMLFASPFFDSDVLFLSMLASASAVEILACCVTHKSFRR